MSFAHEPAGSRCSQRFPRARATGCARHDRLHPRPGRPDPRTRSATGARSPAPKELAREAYDAKFTTRLNLWHVSEEELGRVLLAMGVASSAEVGFPLRLGGCKYDGQGAVRVEPVSASLVKPRREDPEGEGLRELWTGWMRTAKASPWGEAFAPKLRELAKILKPGNG